MGTYIVRRLLLMIPTLLGITVVVFAISRAAPGDPVSLGLGPAGQVNSAQAAAIREARMRLYGLDQPIPIQYARWLGRVVRLDFGDSIKHHRPVRELIAERLPITLLLNVCAFTIMAVVALPVGAISAVHHRRFLDRFSSLVLFILWSLPVMWVGQSLIAYLPRGWFPTAGLSSNNAEMMPFFPWLADRLWHLVLPVLCLSYGTFAYLAKQVRAGMLETLRSDFVRTARAKGCPESVVILRHAFRNSLLPVITILAMVIPAMIGGSVVVETLFSIPGMGRLMFEAVTTRDYNVIMAVATLTGILNLVALLLADIGYAMADPRISFEAAD